MGLYKPADQNVLHVCRIVEHHLASLLESVFIYIYIYCVYYRRGLYMGGASWPEIVAALLNISRAAEETGIHKL